MKIKVNISLILTYIYAFFLIYSPNFSYIIKINNFILLGIFTFFMLLTMMPQIRLLREKIRLKAIVYFIVMIIFSIIYYVIRTLIAGTNITDINNLRIIQGLMPIMYLLGTLIVYIRLDNNNKIIDKYDFIIKVGLIQSIICIMMIFFNEFRNIAINIFYSNHELNKYITASRLYGICDGDYTYSFQILQSIIALLAFTYGNNKNKKKYYLYSIIILFSTVLNGRWGIVVFAVGVLLCLLYSAFINGKIFQTMKMIILLIIVGGIGITLIIKFLPNTVVLFTHAINDILSFLNNGEHTETGRLMEMILFPVGINIIFGCGYRIFGLKGINYGFTKSSDVGFSNDMFMGGIIYVFMLYSPYINFYKITNNNAHKGSLEKIFSKVLLVAFLLSNFKGEVFRSELLNTIFILLSVFMLFESQRGVVEKTNE